MILEAFAMQPAGPKAGVGESSPSPSAPAGSSSAAGAWISFLPLLLLIPLFLTMNRSRKREAEARQKLKVGDQVATQGGLVGELVDFDERFARVKIAPGTTAKFLFSSLAPLEADTQAAASKPAPATK